MSASRLGPHFTFGLAIVLATFVADQASKLWVLYGLQLRPGMRIEVTPFFDLVLTFNPGISYGLFPQESEIGRWALVVLAVAAAALFMFWMARSPSRVVAASLALLAGGALGNALDRAVFGAVVDFVSLHAFGWHWYVFNLADAAIVAGVLGLLYDAISENVTKSPPSG